MQYVQRRLQRSVSETRRSVATRPKVSVSALMLPNPRGRAVIRAAVPPSGAHPIAFSEWRSLSVPGSAVAGSLFAIVVILLARAAWVFSG